MFSILNKSKNYLSVEIKYNILKNVNHVSSVILFSPLNDIIFNKKGQEDEFLYPNKYNVYFKLYNMFSVFANDLSYCLNNPKIQISSSLFFDFHKFSLRDFLRLLLDSNKNIFYKLGLCSYVNSYMNTHIYWSGNLSDTIIVINTNPVLYFRIAPNEKSFYLDFKDIIRNIHADFNTFEILINEMINKYNLKKYTTLINIMYIKNMFLKYLSQEKFKDLNVYFNLSDIDYNYYILQSSCYVKPNLVFLYDKYRKDFLFMYENVYSVNNYYSHSGIRFYNNDLMNLKFYMIRIGKDIELGLLFEFNPDDTYDTIRFNTINVNGESEDFVYKNNKNKKSYKNVFKDRFTKDDEIFKKLYITYLESIDLVFDKVSSESKFTMLNNDDLKRLI